jgi:hypothetical protein
MGNKTDHRYHLVNNVVNNYTGRTKAFLMMLYLSFRDEISANVQMFHSEIGEKRIKDRKRFIEFLNAHQLYNIAIKMKNLDIYKYWKEAENENFKEQVIDDLKIKDIPKFLKETEIKIREAGEEYINKLGRAFL